jgi:hypothetical protein
MAVPQGSKPKGKPTAPKVGRRNSETPVKGVGINNKIRSYEKNINFRVFCFMFIN